MNSSNESPQSTEWAGSFVGIDEFYSFVRDGFWQLKDGFTGEHLGTMLICDPWEWPDE